MGVKNASLLLRKQFNVFYANVGKPYTTILVILVIKVCN